MSDLNQLHREIGEANAKLDILLARDAGKEERIRDLESFRSRVYGIVAGVSAVIAGVTSFILKGGHG